MKRKGRPKKIVEEKDLEEKVLEPYQLHPPCEVKFFEDEFEAERMFPYKWVEKGCLYIGGRKVLRIEVE